MYINLSRCLVQSHSYYLNLPVKASFDPFVPPYYKDSTDMKLPTCQLAVMAALPLTSATVFTASGNISLPNTNTTLLGNIYNHWIHLGNKCFDLTRSLIAPTTKPVRIPMTGSRKSAVIEPSRSALVIIDMQNYFLHPELSPKAEGGRKAIEPTLNMIEGFRENGMPVLWVNWGLDGRDLLDMPAAFLAGFSADGISALSRCPEDAHANASVLRCADTFGSDMGSLSDGTAVGDLLMRGSWNARPYGPLYDAQVEGVKNGTDFYFNKSMVK
jgi:nicotinamidase-related amidase